MTKPFLLLDTNILRSVSWRSAPFQSLLEMCKDAAIDIYLPEVVYEERRTQWRDDYVKKISDARAELNKLISDVILTDDHRKKLSDARDALPDPEEGEALSKDLYSQYFGRYRVTRLPLTLVQAEEALSRYFSGQGPYKAIKNRPDIPDGFVFSSAQELVKTRRPLHCVCGDKELARALSSVGGIVVHTTLDDFLKEPIFVDARTDWEADKTWQKLKSTVPFERVREEIAYFIQDHDWSIVSGKEIRSGKLPEDNHTASIDSYLEHATDITIGEIEEWGGGWIAAPVSFDMEVSISFLIYRADAYDAPDWISVSYGDPEEDHYFDAEADVRIRVTVTVSARVDLRESYSDESLAVLESVSIEGEPMLELQAPL